MANMMSKVEGVIKILLTEEELYLVLDGLGYAIEYGIGDQKKDISKLYEELDEMLTEDSVFRVIGVAN